MDPLLIDDHKLRWHPDRIAQWMAGDAVSPIYLEVSPSSICNHGCTFCGVDFAQQTAVTLDADVYGAALSQMQEVGVRSVMFAGEGEPLLHRELPRMIVETRAHGIDVAITTNGSRGSEGLWGEILPHLSWVKFSVDAGSADTYARVHAVELAVFERTPESIEAAVRVKKEQALPVRVGMQYLVISDDYADLRRVVVVANRLGVDYFVIKPHSVHPQSLEPLDVEYSAETIRSIEAVVAESDGSSGGVPVVFRRAAMEQSLRTETPYQHCYALPFAGYISSRGDFYTCSVFLDDERFRAGNIYTDSFREIVRGEQRRQVVNFGRHELKLTKECRVNCRMARVNEFLEPLPHEPEHKNFI